MNMAAANIQLPKEIEGYMTECREEPGTREWFQDAFHAVAACATDNGEYLDQEAYNTFVDVMEDEDDVQEMLEEMKQEAGLDSLC